MVGKKNVVFGFLFLVLTAGLGPFMAVKYVPDVNKFRAEKQQVLGPLQELQMNQFEQDLDPLSADKIAKENTGGILVINKLYNAESPVNDIKGGPHAHGNLEALLNIVVGIFLGTIAVSNVFKQVISWTFIAGTLLHSGVLYLAVIFQQAWAAQLMGLGIGPVLILLGLFLGGVAAIMGFRGKQPAEI